MINSVQRVVPMVAAVHLVQLAIIFLELRACPVTPHVLPVMDQPLHALLVWLAFIHLLRTRAFHAVLVVLNALLSQFVLPALLNSTSQGILV